MKTRKLFSASLALSVVLTGVFSNLIPVAASAQTLIAQNQVEASPTVTTRDLGAQGVQVTIQLPARDVSIRVAPGSTSATEWVGYDNEDGLINTDMVVTGTAVHGTPGVARDVYYQTWGSSQRVLVGRFDQNGRVSFTIPQESFNAPYKAYTLFLGAPGAPNSGNYVEWDSWTVNGGRKVINNAIQGEQNAMAQTGTPFYGVLVAHTGGAAIGSNPFEGQDARSDLPSASVGRFSVNRISISQNQAAGTATVTFSEPLPANTVMHFYRGSTRDDLQVGGQTTVTFPFRLMATAGGFTLFTPGAYFDWEGFTDAQLSANNQFYVARNVNGFYGVGYRPHR